MQDAQSEGAPHLLDDLEIGRDARAGIKVELDHDTSIHLCI
jgi:hypothetical protein